MAENGKARVGTKKKYITKKAKGKVQKKAPKKIAKKKRYVARKK